MKRCPACHRAAASAAERCPLDGSALAWDDGPRGLRAHNPDDPPPGLGATIVGPPPLPPKDAAAGDAGAPSEAGAERQHTLMYARADVSDAIPDARLAAPAPAQPRPTAPAEAPKATRSTIRQVADAAPAEPADDDARPTLVTSMDGDLDPEVEAERSAYVGKLIDDRYLVKGLIGRGGMGAVYRVEQIHLRKDMAIKLLHENLVARKQLVSRFTREARAI